MFTTQASTISKANRERIWSHYSDVTGWNRWDEALTASDLKGEFAVGSIGTMTIEGNPRPLEFVLLEVNKNESFRNASEMPGIKIEFAHTLEDTADGTKITHQITISGPAWEHVAASIGQKLKDDLPGTLAKLAKLAEHELTKHDLAAT